MSETAAHPGNVCALGAKQDDWRRPAKTGHDQPARSAEDAAKGQAVLKGGDADAIAPKVAVNRPRVPVHAALRQRR